MICSKCPVSEKIASGEYASAEWEQVPCSTCPLNHGKSVTSDKDRCRSYKQISPLDLVKEDDFAEAVEVDAEQSEQFGDFLRQLARLPHVDREAVFDWLNGRPIRETATRNGISIQAVGVRLNRAQNEIEALRELKQVFGQKKVC